MDIIRPTIVTAAMLTAYTIPENDYAAWSAATLYSVGDRCISTTTHKVYESLRGAKNTNVTITNATPGVISWTAHGLAANAKVRFSTTGALPTGLTAGTDYYVSATGLTTNSFSVSATAGGATIATSSAGSGTHTCQEVLNLNYDPTVAANTASGSSVTSSTMWLEVGSTNKWRLFDQRGTEQTSNAGSIAVSMQPGRIDSMAFINVDAQAIRVKMTDATDGVVFDQTQDLTFPNVFNWLEYFTEPIVRKTDIVFDGLPVYGSATVDITISTTSGNVKCGEIIPGLSSNLGECLWGIKAGITDYSTKDVDRYGNPNLKVGKFSKRMSADIFVENEVVDETRRQLASYRATPLVWIASEDFTSTIVFGFYRDFDIVLQSPAGSFCSVSIEGLV